MLGSSLFSKGNTGCNVNLVSLLVTALLISVPAVAAAADGPYKATTESLREHQPPQWFNDAKFGIFIHWGPYAVPAFHEWFVEFMSPGSGFGFNYGGPPYTASQGRYSDEVFDANIRSQGHQYMLDNWGEDFAYDQFIPMFKAEKFDPDAWAKLFHEAGARYVVLTAKHGDEFAMWPTKYTERNSMKMGPKRDLVGDLTKSVRQAGMKMGLYHNTTYSFWDQRFPGRDWVDYMNNTIKELVDLYQPDVIWGDVRTGPVRDRAGKPLGTEYWNSKEVIAYVYNNSKNPDEVLVNDRWGVEPDGTYLGDFYTPERSNIREIREEKWELCDSLDPRSWGYNRTLDEGRYMTPNELVDYLVDIVSKNGNLLINVGPRADGTIPELMEKTLRNVGEWLKTNGEAIYGTTYWDTHEDGDFRFTRKGGTLYAIALQWPEEETVTLTSLAGKKVTSVEMLGLGAPVRFTQNARGLTITMPAKRPCKYAYTFKIGL